MRLPRLSGKPLGGGATMVATKTRRWAWVTVLGTALFAWTGVLLFETIDDWLFILIIGAVLVCYLGVWQTYRAVGDDLTISPDDTEKILRWIRRFGLAGVVQLLLFTYFPGSKFGGH